MRLLVVDDDRGLRDVLRRALMLAGYEVRLAETGSDALGEVSTAAPDAVVLDIGLPDIDGLEVCRLLRREGNRVPVLMLTARDAVSDRIDGLDAGADDYLAKPFDLDELLARLRALHRRTVYDQPTVFTVGDLHVDTAARRVRRGGEEIVLAAREFDILALLMANVGRAVSRYDILDQVWDGETDLRSNVIDVHLASIRAKIDRPYGTNTITTVRGAGYRIDPPEETG